MSDNTLEVCQAEEATVRAPCCLLEPAEKVSDLGKGEGVLRWIRFMCKH